MGNNIGLIEQILREFLAMLKDKPELSIEDIKALESLAAEGKLNDVTAIHASLKNIPPHTK